MADMSEDYIVRTRCVRWVYCRLLDILGLTESRRVIDWRCFLLACVSDFELFRFISVVLSVMSSSSMAPAAVIYSSLDSIEYLHFLVSPHPL